MSNIIISRLGPGPSVIIKPGGISNIVSVTFPITAIAPTTNGLLMWNKPETLSGFSSGSFISTWSGSVLGNNLFQNTGSLQPQCSASAINGYNVASFVANNSYYFTYPDIISGLTSAEIFLVMRINTDPPVSTTNTGFGSYGGFNSERSHYPYTDGVIYNNFCTNARKLCGNPVLDLTTWHLCNIGSETNNWFLNLNGSTFYSTGTNTTEFNPTDRAVGLSLSSTGTSYYLDGAVAELIFYNRILSSTERSTIQSYVSSKFGISIP